MRPVRLRYTVDALNHLEAINDFVAERNPAAARRIAADFRAAALRLCAFPQIGRIGQVPGTHEWVVHGSPYLIVYEVQDASNEIVILGVFHGAQNWQERLK
jgi:toxin ParE1/3/4